MATADKLAKLSATKADLKAALTEKGMNPGNEFDTYPDLVRAIATGAEWEEIIVGTTQVEIVYHSLSDITNCMYTPTYYQEKEAITASPGTYNYWYARNKMGATKTNVNNSSLTSAPITYGSDGSINGSKPSSGSYITKFRWGHILCVNDPEGVSLIG